MELVEGKTLAESRGSVRRGIQMVEVACSAPSLLMGAAIGGAFGLIVTALEWDSRGIKRGGMQSMMGGGMLAGGKAKKRSR